MRQMKDSGVEWIGEVPEGWISAKSKYFITSNDSGVWGEEPKGNFLDKIVVRSTEQTIDGKWNIIDPAIRNIDSPTVISSIKSGDLLITKSSGSQLHIGKTTIADDWFNDKEVYFSNFIQRIRVHDCLPIFIWYLMNSILVREQFVYRQNATSGLGNINACDINNIYFPIPPLPEQEAIASFLDKKCGDIDSLVALQEEMIAELKAYKQSVITEAVTKGLDPSAKMKDSGVEWIGEVPEGWEVLKFKFILNLENNKTLAEDEEIYIGLENIESQSGRYIVSKIRAEGQANKFSKGNILFGKLRPYLAKVWVSEFDGCCSTELLVFSTSSNTEFYKYVLLSAGFIETINSSTYGTKMPRANAEFISQQYIPLPPLPEQHSIATYLDTKTAEIDALISIKQQKITELKEYKKSLIYECVTGKREIPTFCD